MLKTVFLRKFHPDLKPYGGWTVCSRNTCNYLSLILTRALYICSELVENCWNEVWLVEITINWQKKPYFKIASTLLLLNQQHWTDNSLKYWVVLSFEGTSLSIGTSIGIIAMATVSPSTVDLMTTERDCLLRKHTRLDPHMVGWNTNAFYIWNPCRTTPVRSYAILLPLVGWTKIFSEFPSLPLLSHVYGNNNVNNISSINSANFYYYFTIIVIIIIIITSPYRESPKYLT